MVAFTPKPRVVKLDISRAANDQFTNALRLGANQNNLAQFISTMRYSH